MWRTGTPEPTDWQVVFADTTSAADTPGAVGMEMFTDLDAGVPNDRSLDDFEVTEPRAPD